MLQAKLQVFELDDHSNPVSGIDPVNVEVSQDDNRLEISPALIKLRRPGLANFARCGFNGHIDCENAVISIEGFEYFTLAAFINTKRPTLALLRVKGASSFFRLNDLDIDRLASDLSSPLIVDCDVRELNVGIETVLREQQQGGDTAAPRTASMKTDLRGSRVRQARIFVPQSMVTIQRSTLQSIAIEPSAAETSQLHIRENSEIVAMRLHGTTRGLTITDSVVQSLFFGPAASVDRVTIDSGAIVQAHQCTAATFVTPNLDSWNLVMTAAKACRDLPAYTDAAYEYAKLHRTKEKNALRKVADVLFDLSCGYGYKPLRTVLSAAIVWVGCGAAYWALTMGSMGIARGDKYDPEWCEALGHSLYFSAICLTTVGFGDFSPRAWPAMMLSGVEGIGGILLLSLLVFSLTRRYGSQ
jgi:hypothetical protein